MLFVRIFQGQFSEYTIYISPVIFKIVIMGKEFL